MKTIMRECMETDKKSRLMSLVTVIRSHIIHDYFMPSKIADYEEIVIAAKKAGYTFETIKSFDDLIESGKIHDSKRMIIRRDVDTKATRIMNGMHEVENKHNARSTCFFRNKIVMPSLIRQIQESGSIASYHYEEVAIYAEKHKLKTKEAVIDAMPEIKEMFAHNLLSFRDKTCLVCDVVASHGDFINVRLGLSNTIILEDMQYRIDLGISREAYDNEQMKYVTCRIADHSTVNFKEVALEAIRRGEPVIYLLTHPRQWGAAPWANTKENASRLFRGLKYDYR